MVTAETETTANGRADGYQRVLDGIAEIVDSMAAAGRDRDAQLIHRQVWKPLADESVRLIRRGTA